MDLGTAGNKDPYTEPRELEITIFENDQVILVSDGVYFLPPFQAER